MTPGAEAQRASGAAGPVSLAVLIVGMHRSGTSAISGVLAHLGVATPRDLHPADEHNTRGYFEPQKIIDFHEDLFAQLGSPSNDPVPLRYDWVDSPVGEAAAARLAGILDEEMAGLSLCLFKDPRICRLMPVWTRALERSGRGAVAVIPCRHPLEVAGSLAAKAGLSRPYGLMMWLQHVLLGERFTRGMKRSFTGYDALLSDWRSVVGKIEAETGLVWPRDLVRAGLDIDKFLSGELRHQAPAQRPLDADGLERLCAQAWERLHDLQRDASDAKAMAALDEIAAAFDRVLDVSAPLLISYRQDLDATRIELDRTLRGVGELLETQSELREGVQTRDERIVELEDRTRRLGEAERTRDAYRNQVERYVAQLKHEAYAFGVMEADRDLWIERLHEERGRREAEVANAEARLHAFQASTSWKLVTVLQRPFVRFPALRKAVRGAMKLGWWTVTLQVPRKLAERRAFFAAQEAARQAALIAAAAPPAPEPTVVEVRRAGPHIAFLSGEAHTPGHFYRVVRYAEAAQASGATTAIFRREDLPACVPDMAGADLIVIWRAIWDDGIDALVTMAKERGIPILFDVDDLLMEPKLAKSEIIDGIRSQGFTEDGVRHHFELVERTFLAADYCSAPTEMLAHRLRRHGHPAFVLPNGFDDDVRRRSRAAARRRRQEPSDGLIRLGYASGSKTHQKDFAQAAAGIARALREHPNARLVLFRSIWGDLLHIEEFKDFDGLEGQIEWRDMVPIQELPIEVARFDINLAPLEHGNIFCECKSELKYYEAALVDVPTIASPTEPYRNAIRVGETGYLADSDDTWFEAIDRLIRDPALRLKIARAAQIDSIAQYGPERRAELFASVMDQILERGRRGAHAFELDIARKARPRPAPPKIPEHEIVFEVDSLNPSAVTIIVPLYNYAGYVEEALESAKAQTLDSLDLIVVDDRSTDDSLAVARRWIEANAGRFGRAVLVRNVKNAGLAYTRNVGFANADTPFVLALDADNRLTPDCAEKLLEAAERRTAAFAYPKIRQFGDVDRVWGWDYEPAKFVVANYIDAMALIRRAAWAAVGGYDHVQFGWEDFDLWCRLVELGFFGEHVPEPLAEYRVHQSSMLRSETDQKPNKAQVIDEIERRHPWLRIDREPPTA